MIAFSRRQINFIGTVQQKCRFELQKPIKPYGFWCLFDTQLHFCCTVPIKLICRLEKHMKPYGFIGFWSSNFDFCGTVPKKQSFWQKVLYCTKKTLVSWCWVQESWSEPGWSLANGLETFVFLVFVVQYNTFGWNDWFFWYSTAKMKVWASKTNKTIRFYWFLKMAEPFSWYSTAKMKLFVEKITKTICFYWFL